MLDSTIKAPEKSLKWVTRYLLTYTRKNGQVEKCFFVHSKDANNELIRLKYRHNMFDAQVMKCTGYEGKDKFGKYFIPRDKSIQERI